jgi:ATP-dependent RNA helicase DeaD
MTDETHDEAADREPAVSFAELGLPSELLQAVEKIGYESASPIQAEAIPILLAGHDLIGQAQTGTGKTAAFALPLLAAIELKQARPQMLVLTPTRELALQVSEAVQSYARNLKGLNVLPVYGGQGMETQLRRLHRGVHVVVGTPGRIQDHLRRRTLDLSGLKSLVLDEADEMLRMGFIDDVVAILEETPDSRQTALFSATMPPRISQVAKRFLRSPKQVRIAAKTATVATVKQRFVAVTGHNKLEALTRILETERFEAMLIFVRTRSSTSMLAEKLQARGFAAEALSGEMSQAARQRTVDNLKSGRLDILVCTDVAARGLDVDRVTHVINFDIPTDPESYVHRIGRTGRAGREGHAILFVAHRERRLLDTIERSTRQPIERMGVPTGAQIGERRIDDFKQMLSDIIRCENLSFFEAMVASYVEEREADEETEGSPTPTQVAAALTFLFQRSRPMIVANRRVEDDDRGQRNERSARPTRDNQPKRPELKTSEFDADGDGVRYRLDVGSSHGTEVRHIVGCIANESGLSSSHIGRIRIHAEHTTVILPSGMPTDVMSQLSRAWVRGRQLNLKVLEGFGDDFTNLKKSSDRGPGPGSRGPRRDDGPRQDKGSRGPSAARGPSGARGREEQAPRPEPTGGPSKAPGWTPHQDSLVVEEPAQPRAKPPAEKRESKPQVRPAGKTKPRAKGKAKAKAKVRAQSGPPGVAPAKSKLSPEAKARRAEKKAAKKVAKKTGAGGSAPPKRKSAPKKMKH